MKLVLASNNAKKLLELQTLLTPAGVTLFTQGSLNIEEAEEPHHTFIENALAKARHAANRVDAAAIADDSGLCVDALGGLPGVDSAHFASIEARVSDREDRRRIQDAANNALLIARLRGVADRRARFVSTLVAIRTADDPEPLIAMGRWEGQILESPRGDAGFGYDPLMFIPSLGRSVAELDTSTKNAQSHRALAVAHMLALMREAWRLG